MSEAKKVPLVLYVGNDRQVVGEAVVDGDKISVIVTDQETADKILGPYGYNHLSIVDLVKDDLVKNIGDDHLVVNPFAVRKNVFDEKKEGGV